jgi:hypothetical protein
MRKALVNNTTGELENIVMVDPNNLPEVPDGFRMEDETGGSIGQKWTGSVWEDPPSVLASQRKQMTCSKMQGILTLGETKWGEVLAYRETASWTEKMVIDSAQDWHRTSENIQFIGYLIGFNDEQMDTMFITASEVTA